MWVQSPDKNLATLRRGQRSVQQDTNQPELPRFPLVDTEASATSSAHPAQSQNETVTYYLRLPNFRHQLGGIRGRYKVRGVFITIGCKLHWLHVQGDCRSGETLQGLEFRDTVNHCRPMT